MHHAPASGGDDGEIAPSIPATTSTDLEAVWSTIIPPPFPCPLIYQTCYCEENVYKLIQYLFTQLRTSTLTPRSAQTPPVQAWDVHAIFISNPAKTVLLYQQTRSQLPEAGYPVVWDYHVVAAATCRIFSPSPGKEVEIVAERTWIYDPDSHLAYLNSTIKVPVPVPVPTPVDMGVYNKLTFSEARNVDRFRPWFRVVPAGKFVEEFASDRSHMRDDKGEYHMQPPDWDLIVGEKARQAGMRNNLMQEYVDVTKRDELVRYGTVWEANEWLSLKSIPVAAGGASGAGSDGLVRIDEQAINTQ